MRKIPLNVSSISINLLPSQAMPLASKHADLQQLAGWSLINPKFIALISYPFSK
jgi:hypothetical protein